MRLSVLTSEIEVATSQRVAQGEWQDETRNRSNGECETHFAFRQMPSHHAA